MKSVQMIFGGFNPTDGYYNMSEDSIEIELYNDENTRYSFEWDAFTKLFIDYAVEKHKKRYNKKQKN